MKIQAVLIVTLTFASLNPVFAQMKSGDKVVINEKVNHDLYIAGGNVIINSPVDGDLIVAGGTVLVNDSIKQDLLAAGGNIVLNGFVGDDVRCAGGNIQVSNIVDGDLVAAGGSIHIERNGKITGNLMSTAGEVTLDGSIGGVVTNTSGTFTLNGIARNDLSSKGGKILINGTVDGNAVLAANSIQLGGDAQFNENVKYWHNDGALDFSNALAGGNAVFDPSLEIANEPWRDTGFVALIVVWYLGVALLMIFLFEYIFKNVMKSAADTIKETSLKSLGLGLLFILGVPVAIVLFALSIIGIPIGMIMLAGYIMSLMVATVIVAVIIANWINNTYYQTSWSKRRITFTAFGIFIILKLATFTPFIGPLIMFLLVCMAFGGILLNIKWRRSKSPSLSYK